MQIPINKDIRRYQEEIFMGLTLRQLLCSGFAIGLAVLIYLWAKPLLGQETASWLCILAAAPIAAAGFLSYDGLPFEKFVIDDLLSAAKTGQPPLLELSHDLLPA